MVGQYTMVGTPYIDRSSLFTLMSQCYNYIVTIVLYYPSELANKIMRNIASQKHLGNQIIE